MAYMWSVYYEVNIIFWLGMGEARQQPCQERLVGSGGQKAQYEEEKALGDLIAAFQFLKRSYRNNE